MEEQEYIEFWAQTREQIVQFRKLDDARLVFGSRTRGAGHNYDILPPVSDAEIIRFEKANGFCLPLVYRTYLQTFGAGGAGPYYGVVDFRKTIMNQTFPEPFPYTETVEFTDELPDDEPIWAYPGLAFIVEQGCGTEYYLELNGANPGEVWCYWTEECTREGDFADFYRKWVTRVGVGLERYQRIKTIRKRNRWRGLFRKYTLAEVVEVMQCGYTERTHDLERYIPPQEIWVRFDKTPANVIINQKKEVVRIDINHRCSI